MKLFLTQRAPNPRRVTWVIAEKNIKEIEIETIDILALDHKSHPELERAGLYHLPILKCDDGELISESIAIARYLESFWPEPCLFGKDAQSRAIIEMWMRKVELYCANPLAQSIRLEHPALAVLEGPNPDVSDYLRRSAISYLVEIDKQLSKTAFIAGSDFSMADIVLACGLDFGRLIRLSIDPNLNHLTKWYEVIKERPAYKATR
jgi:glutathione S-transferase